MLALHRQYVAQPLKVTFGVSAISRWCSQRTDKTLGFQKSDLGNRYLRKFGTQYGHHLADAASGLPNARFRPRRARGLGAPGANFAGRARRELGSFRHGDGLLRSPIAPEIDEAEFADLYLVAIAQQAFIDKVAVDVGAVKAANIPHHSPLRATGERGMTTRHRDVVEKDVGILMSSDCHDIGIQEKSATSVR